MAFIVLNDLAVKPLFDAFCIKARFARLERLLESVHQLIGILLRPENVNDFDEVAPD